MPPNPTILIVDDDPDGTFFTERSLRKVLGPCFILNAAGGEAAFVLLKHAQIDAIVTDHQLGQQSGSEFIAEVRHHGLACPITMVTGSEDPRVAQKAYEAGVTKVFRSGGDEFAEFLKQQLNARGMAVPGDQR